MLIGLCSCHPRIPEPKHPQFGHTQNPAGIFYFFGTEFPQSRFVRNRVEVWVTYLAFFSSGADHNSCPDLACTVIREHPAGRTALIIRMWTDGQ